MHRKFGKKDVIFIGALLGICLIVLGVWYFAGGKQGASVVVMSDLVINDVPPEAGLFEKLGFAATERSHMKRV